MMNKENLQNEILLEEQKELDRHKITAAQMPKVIEPVVLYCVYCCFYPRLYCGSAGAGTHGYDAGHIYRRRDLCNSGRSDSLKMAEKFLKHTQTEFSTDLNLRCNLCIG